MCPLDFQTVMDTMKHAFKHPWPGNVPLDCPAHFIDTTAILERGRPTRLALSLDTGYHASGWFPNSTMDRCLHLSLSHPRPDKTVLLPNGRMGIANETPSDDEARAWCRVWFPRDYRLALFEPSATIFNIDGRLPGVVHWRLWLNQQGRPIKPTGEAYTIIPYEDGSSPAKVTEGRLGADVR
jgi:hypothetical protein